MSATSDARTYNEGHKRDVHMLQFHMLNCGFGGWILLLNCVVCTDWSDPTTILGFGGFLSTTVLCLFIKLHSSHPTNFGNISKLCEKYLVTNSIPRYIQFVTYYLPGT
jgi:hypothetical protein